MKPAESRRSREPSAGPFGLRLSTLVPRLLLAIAYWLSAIPAQAQIRFDGTDDLIHTSPAQAFSSLNFTSTLSVSFWMIKEAGLAAGAEYLGKGRVANGNVLHWSIRNSSGKFEFNYAAPDATFHNFTTTATFVQTNVPIHIGFTYVWHDSNTATFYINGSRTASAWTAGASNSIGLTNAEPFRIGQTYAGSNTKGQIWEVGIWNGVLTDPEMASLANARRARLPLKIQPANLRLYLPLTGFFPAFTTASGSNAFVSLDRFKVPATPLNSPQQRPSIFSR